MENAHVGHQGFPDEFLQGATTWRRWKIERHGYFLSGTTSITASTAANLDDRRGRYYRKGDISPIIIVMYSIHKTAPDREEAR
jgi:hypothetical protein